MEPLASTVAGRRIVLGVCGGIACYKTVFIARALTQAGAEVQVVLTQGAQEFLRPLVFEGITGIPPLTSLWSSQGSARHLRIAEEADLVLVAPATADFLARAAQGRADDLLSAVLLSTRAPVLLAPAMNTRMWEHPQVQQNVKHVRDTLGYVILGPDSGPLGVGEGEGLGRMTEPEVLTEHVARHLGERPLWKGKHVVITAGPTREPLDPVRYLGNRSSGKMGFALARDAWVRGAEVTLVTGPTPLLDPVGVSVLRVESAAEMLESLTPHVVGADLLIFSAAVGDYRAASISPEKRKRTLEGSWTPELEVNPDIALATLSLGSSALRLGFALETSEMITEARRKMELKGFDWVMANQPVPGRSGFESDTNEGILLSRKNPDEPISVPAASKHHVAAQLLDAVEREWASHS